MPQKHNIYLGYVLTREGIKSHPKKVKAIRVLTPPQNIKKLHRFLGMVQYYRDLWARHCEMMSPLTNLVGECGMPRLLRLPTPNRSHDIGSDCIR
jgi:hypothetical protein